MRYWFIDQLLPGNPSYNIPIGYHLSGPLEVGAVEAALGEIVRRHEVLRTTFAMVAGQPMQQINPPYAIRLPIVDLSGLGVREREAESRRLAAEEARRLFDLARDPLLRGGLIRLDQDEHILLLTMHHIVADGWSLGVLARELSALYQGLVAGGGAELPDLPIQYADYAAWQREVLEGPTAEQVDYWTRQLAGAPTKLELPADRPRPAVQSLAGARHHFELPSSLIGPAESIGRQEGATLFMTLLAAFEAFLYAQTGQRTCLVGSPFANRTRAETEGLIGPFVNTVVLRVGLAGRPTFRELLGRVRATVLSADANQDLPFDRVVHSVHSPRDPSRNPLFQVNFRLRDRPDRSAEPAGDRRRAHPERVRELEIRRGHGTARHRRADPTASWNTAPTFSSRSPPPGSARPSAEFSGRSSSAPCAPRRPGGRPRGQGDASPRWALGGERPDEAGGGPNAQEDEEGDGHGSDGPPPRIARSGRWGRVGRHARGRSGRRGGHHDPARLGRRRGRALLSPDDAAARWVGSRSRPGCDGSEVIDGEP